LTDRILCVLQFFVLFALVTILWRSWSPDPLTFCQCGGPSVHVLPTFRAMQLYMACNP